MGILITKSGSAITNKDGSRLVAIVPGDIDIYTVSTSLTTASLPYELRGTCTDAATVTIGAATGVTVSTVVYDRSSKPLNTWLCQLNNLQVGDNQITVTCSV